MPETDHTSLSNVSALDRSHFLKGNALVNSGVWRRKENFQGFSLQHSTQTREDDMRIWVTTLSVFWILGVPHADALPKSQIESVVGSASSQVRLSLAVSTFANPSHPDAAEEEGVSVHNDQSARLAPADIVPILPKEKVFLAFSQDNTSDVVRRLTQGAEECARLPWIYRIDCLAQVYKRAAGSVAGKPDYRGARTTLFNASRKLDALVEENRDRSEPRVKTGTRIYRPIAATKSVGAAALAILQEAETMLLRSSESRNRRIHYQRIAQAVGSTKVLLRS